MSEIMSTSSSCTSIDIDDVVIDDYPKPSCSGKSKNPLYFS